MTKRRYPVMNIPEVVCVYQIINTANGWVYIGSTIDPAHRFKDHLAELSNNRHTNSKLRGDANKYGPSVFIFSILETLPDSATEAEMFERELYYTKQAHKYGKCYNPSKPRARHNCPKRTCLICGGKHASDWMCTIHLGEWKRFKKTNSISSEEYIHLRKTRPEILERANGHK